MNPGELGPSSTFTMHSDSVDQNTAQIHGQAAASLGLDLQATPAQQPWALDKGMAGQPGAACDVSGLS